MGFLYRNAAPLPNDFTLSTEEVRQVLIRSLYVMSGSSEEDGRRAGRQEFFLDQREDNAPVEAGEDPWYSINSRSETGQHVFAAQSAFNAFRELMRHNIAVQWRVQSDQIWRNDRRVRFQAIGLSDATMRTHPLTRRPVEVLVRGRERLRTIIPGRGRNRRDFVGQQRDTVNYVGEAVVARWRQEERARRLREEAEDSGSESEERVQSDSEDGSGSDTRPAFS